MRARIPLLIVVISSAAVLLANAQDSQKPRILIGSISLFPAGAGAAFNASVAFDLRESDGETISVSVRLPNVRNSEDVQKHLPDTIKRLAHELEDASAELAR